MAAAAAGQGVRPSALSQHDLVLWKSTTTGHNRRRAARVILHGDASDADVLEVDEAWSCLVEDEDDDMLSAAHLCKAADAVLGRDAYKPQDIRRALHVMDLDGDGTVNFFEFKSYMLSNKNASKDADKVKAEASTHTRKTKDGEEVLEDMVTIGTMRITDLISIYRRRAMFECLLKVKERLPQLNNSSTSVSEPLPEVASGSHKLPRLKSNPRRRSQAGEAKQESVIVDAIEGLGDQVKRMFGRIFGGGESSSDASRRSRGSSLRGGDRSFRSGDGSMRAADRSMRGAGERSGKGGDWSFKADVDVSISMVSRAKSKRMQVQTLAQDAAAILSRAEESKAAIAQALQQHASPLGAAGSSALSPTSPRGGATAGGGWAFSTTSPSSASAPTAAGSLLLSPTSPSGTATIAGSWALRPASPSGAAAASGSALGPALPSHLTGTSPTTKGSGSGTTPWSDSRPPPLPTLQLPEMPVSPGATRGLAAGAATALPFATESLFPSPTPTSPGGYGYLRSPATSCPLPAIIAPAGSQLQSQLQASAAASTVCTSPTSSGSHMSPFAAAAHATAPLLAAAPAAALPHLRRREGPSNLGGGRSAAPALPGRSSIVRGMPSEASAYKRGASEVVPSPRPLDNES